MKKQTLLTEILGIDFPVILAPMFLVSNKEMVIAAIKSGATAAIPALNYRKIEELRTAIQAIQKEVDGPFGINLIVNKSNFHLEEQLRVCCEERIDFIITSLGSPKEVIQKAKQKNIKVFCDVTDTRYAKKVEELGADGVIAVNKSAGGHAGKLSMEELLQKLRKNCSLPIISAGGIGTGKGIKSAIEHGACGVSMGSIFIASKEAGVSEDYKQACVEYGEKDIVLTTKLSGTPCTVINTPYVQKVGTKQNFLERILNKNKSLKKWIKALTFSRGMKRLQQAAFSSTYKTVWCAGPSIEYVKSVDSVKEIMERLKREYEEG